MTVIQTGRPAQGSRTGRVWEIADAMFAEQGAMPSGRAVVDAYLAEDPGRNEGTGFTQYSHWKRARLSGPPGPAAAVASRQRVTVGGDGQIVLPAAMVAAIGLRPGEAAIVSLGDYLTVEPAARALARAREIVRRFDRGTGSPVDELLAERRTEAARE